MTNGIAHQSTMQFVKSKGFFKYKLTYKGGYRLDFTLCTEEVEVVLKIKEAGPCIIHEVSVCVMYC